jgi:hypothetical protein
MIWQQATVSGPSAVSCDDRCTRRNTYCNEQSDFSEIWNSFCEVRFPDNDIRYENHTSHGSKFGLTTLLIYYVETVWEEKFMYAGGTDVTVRPTTISVNVRLSHETNPVS